MSEGATALVCDMAYLHMLAELVYILEPEDSHVSAYVFEAKHCLGLALSGVGYSYPDRRNPPQPSKEQKEGQNTAYVLVRDNESFQTMELIEVQGSRNKLCTTLAYDAAMEVINIYKSK